MTPGIRVSSAPFPEKISLPRLLDCLVLFILLAYIVIDIVAGCVVDAINFSLAQYYTGDIIRMG